MIHEIASTILEKIRKGRVPEYLKRNQVKLDDSQLIKIEKSIRKNYHQGWRSEKNYIPEAYAFDLRAHLIERLENDRIIYIPWFNKTIKLTQKRNPNHLRLIEHIITAHLTIHKYYQLASF